MDEKLKRMLEDLSEAINGSLSSSHEIHDRIQRIRDEGYDLFVYLDARIGIDRNPEASGNGSLVRPDLTGSSRDAQFRINVGDLAILRSMGIDPTRKVRATKRLGVSGNTSRG